MCRRIKIFYRGIHCLSSNEAVREFKRVEEYTKRVDGFFDHKVDKVYHIIPIIGMSSDLVGYDWDPAFYDRLLFNKVIMAKNMADNKEITEFIDKLDDKYELDCRHGKLIKIVSGPSNLGILQRIKGKFLSLIR